MYESEEEVKRKRRRLIMIIGIVSLLIVLLIIFLLTKNFIFKKHKSNDITCVLEVMNGELPNSNGVYNKEIDIGFREITSTNKYDLAKKTIGTTDSSKNKETYTITNSGNYKLYGFVEDVEGNKTTCELSVVVSMTIPTCSLEIKSGTLGENGWYKGDVSVGFKSMETNNATLNISKYYITKDANVQSQNNMDNATVSENGTTTLIGVVVDSAGGVGNCNVTVKKDSTAPTCTLTANGTKNSNGEFTDNATISFSTTNDDTSTIVAKGIGTSKNYTEQTYTASNTGKTTVYGYVKDEAGNEGSCSIEVTKAKPEEQKPAEDPKPEVKKSAPTCSLDIAYTSGTRTNNTINSTSDVLINLIPKTTNGATITEYSISVDGGKSYVKNPRKYSTTISVSSGSTTNFEYVRALTSNGTYSVVGFVRDSYGNTGHCPATIGNESTLNITVKK